MSSIRLLIADDSAEFRKTVGLMLGLEPDLQLVAMARDGQEAVDFGRQFQPDVAVMDLHMPRLDGISALRALAKVSPWTACIVVSYEGERETLRLAMASGARDFLVKPFSSDELVNAVRRVAGQAAKERQQAEAQQRAEVTQAALSEKDQALIEQVLTHLRNRRMDDEAARVYLEWLACPVEDLKLLRSLAVVFLTRQDWHTLRLICERLEKQAPLR